MPSSRDGSERDVHKAELQALFDKTLLDSGYIVRFHFDLYQREVAIRVRVTWADDDVREYDVVFSAVHALYFQHELDFPHADVAAGYDPALGVPWSWLGYKYYDRPVVIRLIDAPHGLERVGMTMNFALDIFGSNGVLLLAAGGVSIDGKYFDVGVPPKPQP